ncbi:MAG: RNA polymerase sigma factor SigJ [Planctomycetota bacterium]
MIDADIFEEHRPFLTGLAYRMLGSAADAEDMVQETFLRWRGADGPKLDEPRAWFARTCTRLCLDRLRAARRERETYPGEWLPEPLVGEGGDCDGSRAELDESLSMAMLVTIERLSPKERAAFLLHDIFRYSFDEAADVLELTPASCRQLAVRARRRLEEGGRARTSATDRRTVERLTRSFFEAIEEGDDAQLRAVLADDVVLRADGGGRVTAAPKPVHGAQKVARFLIAVSRPKGVPLQMECRWRDFNGSPGVLVFVAGDLASAYQLEVVDGCVAGVYVVRNPDKLAVFDGP